MICTLYLYQIGYAATLLLVRAGARVFSIAQDEHIFDFNRNKLTYFDNMVYFGVLFLNFIVVFFPHFQ